MENLKILMGGSTYTHWSIAQQKNRETEPSGLGWELFLNYRIARDKYQPDYFLYENKNSIAPAIRAQITKELGVEPVLINSAIVSAQSCQRLYWFGKRNPNGTYSQVYVEQPEDRRILLRDVLESGIAKSKYTYAEESVNITPQTLTVTECKRLQTVPEWYTFPVSDTQAYKMLCNGWTVDVIAHILSHIPWIAMGPVEVLSMYDGMSCGHIALDKLGANVVSYYATETDKYAIQTTQANYPDTVQLGDAFQVRDDGWKL